MVLRIIISIVLAFFAAQTSKFIINYKTHGRIEWNSFLQNGGMPSSHTSTVIALTTGIFLETGWSYYFIICVLFSGIVMNDAMKVRRQTGEEAKLINIIMERMEIFHQKLSELVGHTPLQVAVGFLVGVVSTLIIYSF